MILHALSLFFLGLVVWNIFILFSEGLKPPSGLRPSICLDAHHSVPSTWDRKMLVVWNMILFFVPYIGNNRAPTDFHRMMIPTDELIIFQRGRYTTNQNVLDMYWTCGFVSDIQFWGQFQVELLEIRPAWQSPHSDHQRMSHQLNRGFRFHQIRLVESQNWWKVF